MTRQETYALILRHTPAIAACLTKTDVDNNTLAFRSMLRYALRNPHLYPLTKEQTQQVRQLARTPTVQLSATVPAELKAQLQARAKQQEISLSTLIARCLAATLTT